MAKVQKKNSITSSKPLIARKSGDGTEKTLAKDTKSNKTSKKIAEAVHVPGNDSKQSMILALLQRTDGATIDEMAKTIGWQRHSVHGMMSGVLKKKLGLMITSDKEKRGRVYRITDNVSRL